MGTFGLVSRPLSDFAMLLYLRLALLSGSLYLVFNRVSFRQGRVAARRHQNLIAISPAVWPSTRNGIARCCTGDASVPILGKREDLEEVRRHDHLSQVNVREESGKLPLVSHLRALWNPATEVVRLPSAADRGGPCRAGPNCSLRGWNPGQISHRGARPTRSAAGGSVRLEGPADREDNRRRQPAEQLTLIRRIRHREISPE